MSIRVLVVDDHPVICQGLRLLLDREPGIEVVGEAHDGRSAIEMACELRPQVVLMDLAMPQLNGVDASRRILAQVRNTKVVALSALSNARTVADAMAAGMSAFVPKEGMVDELVTAIRTAAEGGMYLSPRIAATLPHQCGAAGSNGGTPAGIHPVELSPREREVLQLIAEGKATKEVARCLNVNIKTVETHRRSMMEKLRLDSVAELTKYAVREGITSLER
jgi:DNA-binding NarL/FixJ family response regulator